MQPGDIIPEAMSWENFKMTFFGFTLIKFNAFKLDSKSKFVVNKGKDGEAISWSVKDYERSCETTLHIEELKNLIPIAPGGDLLKLPPAPITAQCLVENVGTLKFTIPAAKIIEYPLSFKEGDEKSEVAIKLGLTSYPIVTFS
jgi:hypothetical protein